MNITDADHDVELGANVAASGNISLHSVTTTITANVLIESKQGNIFISGTSTDGVVKFDLDLITSNGTTDVAVITTGSLDIVGDAATLRGSITSNAAAATGGVRILTAGGLATLANDITITTDDTAGTGGEISLGALDGAQTLTIDSDAAVTLRDADIQSLSVVDATTVDFDGDFFTSGTVTVGTAITGQVTVASAGSIQAGGNVSIDNTAAAATVDIVVDGDIAGSNAASVSLTANDDIQIGSVAGATNATVSAVNGVITFTAQDVILGADTGATGADDYADGRVVTTGDGNVVVAATESFVMTAADAGGGTADTADSVIIAGGTVRR